jgi:hypothetical protein
VLKKSVYYYEACATILGFIFFTVLVLFTLLNAVLFVAYKIKDSYPNAMDNVVYKKYGEARVMQVYPGYTEDDVSALLKETWQRPYEFEPYTQIKEHARVGKWVNVDENGFRLTKNQGPWPPDLRNLNVFLFGGSTTFGYGVADDQTIASHLQEFFRGYSKKEVKVYNFGRGTYYSTQERILFEKMLVEGFVPDVALFIDGINDFIFWDDKPEFTKSFAALLDGTASKEPDCTQRLLSKWPATRLASSIKSRIISHSRIQEGQASLPDVDTYNDEKVFGVIKRYSQTKLLIEAAARAYGIRPVFVWQPVPLYKYDLKYHVFALHDFGRVTYSKYGYPVMAKVVKENPGDYSESFLWLADIQEQSKEPLYVDVVHYSAKLNKELAAHIGHLLVERNLLTSADAR